MTKFKIALVDRDGNEDLFAAGDPAPGRGVNEFVSREDALAAIKTLEPAGEGERWEVVKYPRRLAWSSNPALIDPGPRRRD